jgi:hypothetical protein
MTTQIDGQSAAEYLIAQGLFTDAGVAAIAAGRLHVGDDGSYAALTIDAKPPKEARAAGSVLIGTASWLLGLLAAGLFIVSFAGQYQYIFAARQQKIAAVIEAGMLDVGMVIFSLLALGLSRAGKLGCSSPSSPSSRSATAWTARRTTAGCRRRPSGSCSPSRSAGSRPRRCIPPLG